MTGQQKKGKANLPSSDESGTSQGRVIVGGEPMALAIVEVNKHRISFRHNSIDINSFFDRFDTHPDMSVVTTWLRNREDPGLELDVIFHLSAHVLSEWNANPKFTKKQHKLFFEIEDTAKRLAKMLERTGDFYVRGGGLGLAKAQIHDLLNDSEEADILRPLEKLSEAFEIPHPDASFPTVEKILNRVAKAARRLGDQGPIHSQPKKRGARTGYFIRRLAFFLDDRYGEVPDRVMAALATVVLNETVDEGLAHKHRHLKERSMSK